MLHRKLNRVSRVVACLSLLPTLTVVAAAQVTGSPPVDAEPILRVPTVDYRKDWVQLGTFSVLADSPSDGAKELHITYTERKNVEAFREAGTFPDGAVLVKDVWSAKTEPLTTGTASYTRELAARFVMVRDAQGKLGSGTRFGDGWGWAFYERSETVKTVTGDYKIDCLSCHEPVRDQGLLYLQGYPVLRNQRELATRASGNERTSAREPEARSVTPQPAVRVCDTAVASSSNDGRTL